MLWLFFINRCAVGQILGLHLHVLAIKPLLGWLRKDLVPPTSVFISGSVQLSHSVVSDSLWPHESQHSRLPCPSPTQETCTNSCPSSQWCRPTISSSVDPFSSCLWSFPASGSFQGVSSSHQVAKVLELQLHISPSSEYSGLISFRIDWFDIFAVQETLKSLLQHYGSKASILWCSAFFIVQLSYPYMTTEKAIALARQTFVDKVMSLLFTLLYRWVITFLPRSKDKAKWGSGSG